MTRGGKKRAQKKRTGEADPVLDPSPSLSPDAAQPAPSREELLRRLRRRRADARNGGGASEAQRLAKAVVDDPAGGLLSLGIDDPELLKSANDIVRAATASAKRRGRHAQKGAAALQQVAAQQEEGRAESEGDEEAPPCDDLHH